jgi:hypothetical protein
VLLFWLSFPFSIHLGYFKFLYSGNGAVCGRVMQLCSHAWLYTRTQAVSVGLHQQRDLLRAEALVRVGCAAIKRLCWHCDSARCFLLSQQSLRMLVLSTVCRCCCSTVTVAATS